MGWVSSRGPTAVERDVLLSVGSDGELMFWVPEGKGSGWRCTGSVRTGRKKIRMARCSSAKKTVLSTFPLLQKFREISMPPCSRSPYGWGRTYDLGLKGV